MVARMLTGGELDKQRRYGVTLDGQFFPVTNRKSWLAVRQVMDTYVELLESKSALTTAEDADTSGADTMPVRVNLSHTRQAGGPGTRAIDALLLALLDNGGELARADAPAVVARYGWSTSDSTRPASLIGLRAKRYPQWIEAGEGQYVLTPEGRKVALQIKSVLMASARNREDAKNASQ